MSTLLDLDPRCRPTATEALNHPWLADLDKVKDVLRAEEKAVLCIASTLVHTSLSLSTSSFPLHLHFITSSFFLPYFFYMLPLPFLNSFIILYHTMLCYAILYHTILYHTILYHTLLNHTLLCNTFTMINHTILCTDKSSRA